MQDNEVGVLTPLTSFLPGEHTSDRRTWLVTAYGRVAGYTESRLPHGAGWVDSPLPVDRRTASGAPHRAAESSMVRQIATGQAHVTQRL